MPSLEKLEALICHQQLQPALQELTDILALWYERAGVPGADFGARIYASVNAQALDNYIMARLAAAACAVLAHPQTVLTRQDYNRLIGYYPTLCSVLAASPFRNADHMLYALTADDKGRARIPKQHFFKFCLLYSVESELPFDPQTLWQIDQQAAAALFMAMLSMGLMAMPAAHAKRELLLAWLPARLAQIQDLRKLPLCLLHGAYMQCSYADLPEKHDIKKSINQLIRNLLTSVGLTDLEPSQMQTLPVSFTGQRPKMFVILEWFSRTHAIYRTHSSSLRALRDDFELIGIGFENSTDDTTRALFDEFHVLYGHEELEAQIRRIRTLSMEQRPAVVYYPAVGMVLLTVLLSNLRLAPVQVSALGHGATTHSHCIDYMLFEQDYLGERERFSEQVIALPAEAMPHVPPVYEPSSVTLGPRALHDPVRIAIISSVMKLNPRFLRACQAIEARAQVPIEFHFFDGGYEGLAFFHLRNVISYYLPNARIDQRVPYGELMQQLQLRCDLFIDPFPFGNMNGLVDCLLVGLPGVCLSGLDPHFHIDEGIMRRINLPSWLIAHDVDSYVAAVLRLVHESETRAALRAHIQAAKPEQLFFQGQPKLFSKALREVL